MTTNTSDPISLHNLTQILPNRTASQSILSIPSEDSILSILNTRYRSELNDIYIGQATLLHINPLGPTTDQNDESARSYLNTDSSSTSNPPHLYDLASRAFYTIRRSGKTQAIVYSGLSGSGKTASMSLISNQLIRLTDPLGSNSPSGNARPADKLQRQLPHPGPLAVTPALGAGTNPGQGLFIECFATCALILSVLFLAVEKHRATFLAPVGIGITLFAGHMFATVYTGAAMNTARAFGPPVITGFGSDHWVYWVGPTLGSFLAVAIYAIMKRFKYWKLNEGQDTDESSKSPALFFQEEPEHTNHTKPSESRAPSMRVLPSIGQTLGAGQDQREKNTGLIVRNQPEGGGDRRERQDLMVRQPSGIEEMV